ncbi:LuxR C-terminal-related transcriptional regulator [Sphingomonas sp. DT-204]|uniref:LuxR C-terminal-related transcriptional regulator n=1 Tax=Sphingomonas sp. DT-204 TaxID=3396166 RepID=UPI003F194FB9
MTAADSPPKRIIVADGQPIFREAMLRIAEEVFPKASLYDASDLDSLMARRRVDPDLIVLDFLCPDYDPVFSARWLRGEFPNASIIFVSTLSDRRTIANVLTNGADGFISKSATPDEMRVALRGQDCGLHRQQASPPPDHGEGLTPRQREILDLIAEGRSNKEIGRALNISPFTVRIHVSAVLRYLGVETRAAAVARAISIGLSPRFQ